MLKESELLYPVKALAFEVHPSLSIFSKLHIPVSEFADHRTQCRTFEERYEITAMENDIQLVIDFWSANQSNLPGLFSAVQKYSFLTGSSDSVERAISQFNKILSDDCRSLDEENLENLKTTYAF